MVVLMSEIQRRLHLDIIEGFSANGNPLAVMQL